MAYNHRPPMMPGMMVPGPPFMGGPMQMGIPMGQPMPMSPMMGRPMRPLHMPPSAPRLPPAPPGVAAPNTNNKPPSFSKRVEHAGPAVTVFVGNITERAPEVMMRQILNTCGPVLNWKRVLGASGKLQAFGFCEFANPDSALRAIRLLHDYEIADRKLVVKADAKTEKVIEEYKESTKKTAIDAKKNKEEDDSDKKDKEEGEEDDKSSVEEGEDEEEDYMTEQMTEEDAVTRHEISKILGEHRRDILNYIAPPGRGDAREKKMTKVQSKLAVLSGSNPEITTKSDTVRKNLDEMEDVEEGKKELITSEIIQFRELMKKQEEEKERKQRERERERPSSRELEREAERERILALEKETERARARELKQREKEKEKDRERERIREAREREREREREIRREREREREESRRGTSRERPPKRSQSGSPESSRRRRKRSATPVRKSDADLAREKEEAEEEKERRESERKIRKKECQYQDRLKSWESREHKKSKEIDREKDKEASREKDRVKEAKRLKQFLEDYDDDRDDAKHYKGHAFSRKTGERELEKEADNKDRAKEKDELEDLKTRVMLEGHPDPDTVYKKAVEEREWRYRPVTLLRVRSSHIPVQDISDSPSRDDDPVICEPPSPKSSRHSPVKTEPADKPRPAPVAPVAVEAPVSAVEETQANGRSDSESRENGGEGLFNSLMDNSVTASHNTGHNASHNASVDASHNGAASPQSSDDDGGHHDEPLSMAHDDDISQDAPTPAPLKRKKFDIKDVFNQDDGETQAKKRPRLPLPVKAAEDKRKNIKSLIDRIPTSKDELFAFPVDHSMVDEVLMEKRIRPWINKKIIEYIGEPEPTLVEFICGKVLRGSDPASLLSDVAMVLDEEAEVFVVKMWRLLIYEVEARRAGVTKV